MVDLVRKILIEEMKTRDLDSDEIRYLMDTKDRSELKTEKMSYTQPRTATKQTQRDTQVPPKKPLSKKIQTWDLMKQTADPKELKELKAIENRDKIKPFNRDDKSTYPMNQMDKLKKEKKLKDTAAYQVAQRVLDAQIKVALEKTNQSLSTKEPEPKDDFLERLEKEMNIPDPDLQKGLGELAESIDFKRMNRKT